VLGSSILTDRISTSIFGVIPIERWPCRLGQGRLWGLGRGCSGRPGEGAVMGSRATAREGLAAALGLGWPAERDCRWVFGWEAVVHVGGPDAGTRGGYAWAG
jgi:hypothetical protein